MLEESEWIKLENNIIDWIIGIANGDDPESSNVDFVTIGFQKYGFGNVIVSDYSIEDTADVCDLINTFCLMLINGAKFDANCTHCIKSNKRGKSYNFDIEYLEYSDGTKIIELVPYDI